MCQSFLDQGYALKHKTTLGTFGEILVLRHTTGALGFQRDVYLKTVPKEILLDADLLKKIQQEIHFATVCNHPNLIRLSDLKEDGDNYLFYLDPFSTTSLQQLIETSERRAQYLDFELAIGLITQVLEGLHHLHSLGKEADQWFSSCLFDIRPINVFVGIDGYVKINNMVLSLSAGEINKKAILNPIQDSFARPPELAPGQPRNILSDIFNVGLLLYEMTVGQRFFSSLFAGSILYKLGESLPPPTFARANYPVDLETIVMRAIEQTPSRRFGSTEEMLDALERFTSNASLRTSKVRLGGIIARLLGSSQTDPPVIEAAEAGYTPIAPSEQLQLQASPPEEIPTQAAIGLVESPAFAEGSTTLTSGQVRARRMMEAVQHAHKAIAELVAASDGSKENEIILTAKRQLADGSEVSTAPLAVASKNSMQGMSVQTPLVKKKRESTIILTEDLVEDEFDLDESNQEIFLERAQLAPPPIEDISQCTSVEALGLLSVPPPTEQKESTIVITEDLVEEEVVLEEPAQRLFEQRDTSRNGSYPEYLPVNSLAHIERNQGSRLVESVSPRAVQNSIVAKKKKLALERASTDLLEALAAISAELKAAEESDRRREEALARLIKDENTQKEDFDLQQIITDQSFTDVNEADEDYLTPNLHGPKAWSKQSSVALPESSSDPGLLRKTPPRRKRKAGHRRRVRG